MVRNITKDGIVTVSAGSNSYTLTIQRTISFVNDAQTGQRTEVEKRSYSREVSVAVRVAKTLVMCFAMVRFGRAMVGKLGLDQLGKTVILFDVVVKDGGLVEIKDEDFELGVGITITEVNLD